MGRDARIRRHSKGAKSILEPADLFQLAKQATVAIAFMLPRRSPTKNAPFKIVGSGVCIDSRGVIITCRHVLQSFVGKDLSAIAPVRPGEFRKERTPVNGAPYAVFYVIDPKSTQMVVECQSLVSVETTPERDVCVGRVSPCERFADAFPTMGIEEFDQIHEGMEVATCGFPLGNILSK